MIDFTKRYDMYPRSVTIYNDNIKIYKFYLHNRMANATPRNYSSSPAVHNVQFFPGPCARLQSILHDDRRNKEKSFEEKYFLSFSFFFSFFIFVRSFTIVCWF